MIYETYSKRKKSETKNTETIYIYDDIPQSLRHQIIYIWTRVFGNGRGLSSYESAQIHETYKILVEILREEMGEPILPPSTQYHRNSYQEELIEFFLHETNVDKVLDIIQLSFHFIDTLARDFSFRFQEKFNEISDQAIADLNERFKEHDIGYRFEGGQIISINSEFIYTEITTPVLKLLTSPEFAGAQEEFITAYNHYKHGRKKEVLDACLKAFESIMKIICKKRGWYHHPNATASPLIKTRLENKLIPDFFQSKAEGLKSLLESGIPTVGNKVSRHGQGTEVKDISNALVAYALHETASTILLFVHAETELDFQTSILHEESSHSSAELDSQTTESLITSH